MTVEVATWIAASLAIGVFKGVGWGIWIERRRWRRKTQRLEMKR